MDFKTFSRINRQRSESPDGFNHTLESWSPVDWTNACAGEAGEACNKAKKLKRLEDGLPGNKADEQDREKIRLELLEEFADVIIYADLGIQSLRGNTSKEVIAKFNKVSNRIGCSIKLDKDEIEPLFVNYLAQLAIAAQRVIDEWPSLTMMNTEDFKAAIKNLQKVLNENPSPRFVVVHTSNGYGYGAIYKDDVLVYGGRQYNDLAVIREHIGHLYFDEVSLGKNCELRVAEHGWPRDYSELETESA